MVDLFKFDDTLLTKSFLQSASEDLEPILTLVLTAVCRDDYDCDT